MIEFELSKYSNLELIQQFSDALIQFGASAMNIHPCDNANQGKYLIISQ